MTQTSRLVVCGGVVADGSGGGLFEADVEIRDGRVTDIGTVATRGADVIDARGHVVAPGLIDTHTHSDAVGFLGPEHDALRLASLRQGVTTEIAGNCGFSLFPAPAGAQGAAVSRHLDALFGPGTPTMASIGDYGAALERAGSAANVASLVGQGTLRAAVVGFERRAATAAEVARMADLAEAAFTGGAAGLSTGLLYPPGSYADTDELAALAAVAAAHGRPYVSHIRDEMDGVAGALDEAIAIGEAAGCAVHVSHLKAGGSANHGRMPALLGRLDEARDRGVDVTADIYPYTAGSTMLHALLPPWATEGGVAATLGRLADPSVRDRIRSEFLDPPPRWQNFLSGGSWEDVTVASAPGRPDVEGSTVADLAAATGADPIDTVCALLIAEEAAVTIVVEMAAEADMEACLRWPHTTVGSDGIPIPGKPHPRWAGSFARVLGRCVRDRGLLDLAEAIAKMTSRAALRFGLGDRGQLRPGAAADLVVFDAERIADRATYADPLLPPQHVPHVVVNGEPVIRDHQDTGARSGRFLTPG